MEKTFSYLVIAVLVAAAIICYMPGLDGPFLFDDISNIVANSRLHITELSWDKLIGAITSLDSGPLKRPIATISFALNYYFSGLSPFAFKVTNLVIHILNSTAIYILAVLILLRMHQKQPHFPSIKYSYWIAAAAALLWTIHPLNLSSVLYIVQRMTSLSSLFTVVGLVGYCIGRNRLISGRKDGLALSVISLIVFGILAVLSKENGVLIFPYALVIELFLYRFKVNENLGRNYTRSLIALYAVPVIIGLVLAPFFAHSVLRLDVYDMRQFNLTERLMTEARVMWFYLRLIAAPTPAALGLYHDYFHFSTSLTEPVTTLISIIMLLALTVAGVAIRNRLPLVSLAVFWFLAGHILESTIIPLELIHEHRNYLAMFGPILATTYYLLYKINKPESIKLWSGLFILIILLFAVATFARSSIWSNEYRMKLTQLLDHPDSARANSDMAILLHNNRQLDKAEELFTKAAQLDPEPPHQLMRLLQHLYVFYKPVPREYLEMLEFCARNTPYSNVTIWQYEGLLNQARLVPEDHVRILNAFKTMVTSGRVKLSNKWSAKSHSILGVNYLHIKKVDLAIDEFKKAIAEDSKEQGYVVQLANAYHHNNEFDKAVSTLNKITDKNKLPEPLKKPYDTLKEDLKIDMSK